MEPVEPLRSVHTSNFPSILEQLNISLLVTTYQAGKLVMLRPENGLLNTHFRVFEKPMGLAVESNRLAIGTAMQVWEFHNIPAVCKKLDSSRVVPQHALFINTTGWSLRCKATRLLAQRKLAFSQACFGWMAM